MYIKKLALYKKAKVNYLVAALVILGFLSTFFQLLTLNYSLVAELEALKRSIGVIASLFFGYYFFKEKVNLSKVLAVIIIVVGVCNIIIFT